MIVYNATKYTAPDSQWTPITVIYESTLVGPRPADPADNNDVEIDWPKLDAVISTLPSSARVVFDIELWSINSGGDETMWKNICKYKEITRYVKYKRPDINIGHFAKPTWHSPQNEADNDFDWRVVNRNMEYIGEFVDTIYPSCYVRFNDFASQYLSMDNTLTQAERYNKEIIPFICPRIIAPIDAGSALNGDDLPLNTFTAILDFMNDKGLDVIMWDFSANTTPYEHISLTQDYTA